MSAIGTMSDSYFNRWMLSNNTSTSQNSWVYKGSYDGKTISRLKKIILSFMSICLIIYGIFVLVYVSNHITASETYCNSVTEENYFVNGSIMTNNISLSDKEIGILQKYPESFFYDKCLYKVYPFIRNGEDKYASCQCRVLVIKWNELNSNAIDRQKYFNLTQQIILDGMFEHWVMLEKFKTVYSENTYAFEYELPLSLYQSVHMKAFEWSGAKLSSLPDGISAWTNLEYLYIGDTNNIQTLPIDFDELRKLKFLSLSASGVTNIDDGICSLNQLEVLRLDRNYIEEMPECIGDLVLLRQLYINSNLKLIAVPLSVFNLTQLVEFSISFTDISYFSLLNYNTLSNMSINDTDSIDQWFDTEFMWNNINQTTYSLLKTAICDEEIFLLPMKLQQFINETNACFDPCSGNNADPDHHDISLSQLCSPILFGDGKCDLECANAECYYDGGDCIQLCFANPQLTNCSMDKFKNDKCDDGCNNAYCTFYHEGIVDTENEYAADNQHCLININETHQNASQLCMESESIYVNYSDGRPYTHCQPGWLNDGVCDDLCRTDECGQDYGDCDRVCGDVCSIIYYAWLQMLEGDLSEYNVNITWVCNNWWQYLNPIGANQDIQCLTFINDRDYNRDEYLNFREFSTDLVWLFGSNDQSTNVNCSSCVGVDHYDPIFVP